MTRRRLSPKQTPREFPAVLRDVRTQNLLRSDCQRAAARDGDVDSLHTIHRRAMLPAGNDRRAGVGKAPVAHGAFLWVEGTGNVARAREARQQRSEYALLRHVAFVVDALNGALPAREVEQLIYG